MFPEFLKEYLPIVLFLVIALGLSGAFIIVNFTFPDLNAVSFNLGFTLLIFPIISFLIDLPKYFLSFVLR